ncbi:hypothetical protein ADL12_45140 [Streptomyces regalis]|uniref:Uncharacterized protein n=1 Tax=Streptomyces regalis TaxID=68262 RepID=A0A101J760_9ACTN|nr:hypothetical protein ADL12_45140 [Streptomyces regalis]
MPSAMGSVERSTRWSSRRIALTERMPRVTGSCWAGSVPRPDQRVWSRTIRPLGRVRVRDCSYYGARPCTDATARCS